MNDVSVITEKLEQEILSMDARVQQAIAAINDEESCDVAANMVRQCADQIDHIESQLGPNRDDMRKSYERLRDKINDIKKPYLEWKAKINAAISAWRVKAKAEIEEANRKRLEAAEKEAKAKAEKEAAKLEKKGEPELAAAIRSEVAFFAPPLQVVPSNKGVVDKITWQIEISGATADQWRLIKFIVAQGPAAMGALTINAAHLKKLASLRHEEMKSWPGLRVYQVHTSEIRRDSRRQA